MKKRYQSEDLTSAGKRAAAPARAPLAARLKRRILKQYFVRLHMALILTATIASGLVASKLLLEAGAGSVLVRYPLAVLFAYAAFLGMTRLWVRYTVVNRNSSPGIAEDAFDAALDVIDDGGSSNGSSRSFAFGGGGSRGDVDSDLWDSPAVERNSPRSSPLPGFDLSIDLDDGIWILLTLAAVILAVFGAGAYLIWAAPEILPEIALSALLASSLKRSAQRAEAGGWLGNLLRSTAVPFAVVLILVCALAYAVHHTCPGARRLSDALSCVERAQ